MNFRLRRPAAGTAAAALLCMLANPTAAHAEVSPSPVLPAVTQGKGAAVLPAGTPVALELLDSLRSNTAMVGQKFAFKLHEDLTEDGVVLIPAGTRGSGVVTHAQSAGLGGRAGELILSPRALDFDGVTIALHGQDGSAGESKSEEAALTNMGTRALGLGFGGIFIEGGNLELPLGALIHARLADSFPAGMAGVAPVAIAPMLDPDVSRRIGELPADQATVVFFRTESVQSMSFKVRDGDVMIGQLGDAEFMVMHLPPGPHTIWAYKKDPLPLDLDAGQVYFVEGSITTTFSATRYELSPSGEARFRSVLPYLNPAKHVYHH